jgi:hypothetical protein
LITFGSNWGKVANVFLPSLDAGKCKHFFLNFNNNISNAVTNKIRLFFDPPLLSLLSNGAATFSPNGNFGVSY